MFVVSVCVAVVLVHAHAPSVMQALEQSKFYDEELTRSGANLLLELAPAGAFVLRGCVSRPGCIVLSYKVANGDVKHTLVQVDPDGLVLTGARVEKFAQLRDLLSARALNQRASESLRSLPTTAASLVLNARGAAPAACAALSASELAFRLASSAFAIYRRHQSALKLSGGDTTPLRRDAEYASFAAATRQLRLTVVAPTAPFEERLVFFCNVYHTLLLHASMFVVRGAKDGQKQVCACVLCVCLRAAAALSFVCAPQTSACGVFVCATRCVLLSLVWGRFRSRRFFFFFLPPPPPPPVFTFALSMHNSRRSLPMCVCISRSTCPTLNVIV